MPLRVRISSLKICFFLLVPLKSLWLLLWLLLSFKQCCRRRLVAVIIARGGQIIRVCALFCLTARGGRGHGRRKGKGPGSRMVVYLYVWIKIWLKATPRTPLPPHRRAPPRPLLSAVLYPPHTPKPRALTYISRNETKERERDKIKQTKKNIHSQGGVSRPFGSHSVTVRRPVTTRPPPLVPALYERRKKRRRRHPSILCCGCFAGATGGEGKGRSSRPPAGAASEVTLALS